MDLLGLAQIALLILGEHTHQKQRNVDPAESEQGAIATALAVAITRTLRRPPPRWTPAAPAAADTTPQEAPLDRSITLMHAEYGVFYAANQLYGISFKERKDVPVYHPDVRVFEVSEANGTTIGLMYFDYWKRDNKTASSQSPQSTKALIPAQHQAQSSESS